MSTETQDSVAEKTQEFDDENEVLEQEEDPDFIEYVVQSGTEYFGPVIAVSDGKIFPKIVKYKPKTSFSLRKKEEGTIYQMGMKVYKDAEFRGHILGIYKGQKGGTALLLMYRDSNGGVNQIKLADCTVQQDEKMSSTLEEQLTKSLENYVISVSPQKKNSEKQSKNTAQTKKRKNDELSNTSKKQKTTNIENFEDTNRIEDKTLEMEVKCKEIFLKLKDVENNFEKRMEEKLSGYLQQFQEKIGEEKQKLKLGTSSSDVTLPVTLLVTQVQQLSQQIGHLSQQMSQLLAKHQHTENSSAQPQISHQLLASLLANSMSHAK